jgi:hypothetical protein
MNVPGGIARPMVAVLLEGPAGRRLIDGLLDSGADRTIFPGREASAIGLGLPSNPDGMIRTASGVPINYRLAEVILELRSAGLSVRWKVAVAFAEDPLTLVHLGYRGFLEYFHSTFLGPEKKVVLDPRPTLPRV